MARILAANPNSIDAERLIPTYNKIEAGGESSITPEKLNKYINIAINMLDLASFQFREQMQRYGSKKQKNTQVWEARLIQGSFLKVKGNKNSVDRDWNKPCKRVSITFAHKL